MLLLKILTINFESIITIFVDLKFSLDFKRLIYALNPKIFYAISGRNRSDKRAQSSKKKRRIFKFPSLYPHANL